MAIPKPLCLAEKISDTVPLEKHAGKEIESARARSRTRIPFFPRDDDETTRSNEKAIRPNTHPAFVNGLLPAVPAKNLRMINVHIF
jgi:hypothetical protein